jgi:hypothetical protein
MGSLDLRVNRLGIGLATTIRRKGGRTQRTASAVHTLLARGAVGFSSSGAGPVYPGNMAQSSAVIARIVAALVLACVPLAASCGGAHHTSAWTQGLADSCDVVHTLRAGDEVDGRVSRISDGWALSLHMRLRIDPNQPFLDVRGLGRVVRSGGEMRCEVVETTGVPGAPRFDGAVCLDEFESLEDLLSDAQDSAAPGQTVVQEVRLRVRRRHRARSRVVPGSAAAFQERAEITRDGQGRVVHVVRTDGAGAREEVVVNYPSNTRGRCLALE